MESSSIAAATAPVYPLKVSPNGRYLVDQNDRPWRIQADAAWLMSSVATPDEVDQYLDTRQAQGFNSFYLMADGASRRLRRQRRRAERPRR